MASLIVFVILVGAAAATGLSFEPGRWYAVIAKPEWTPPGWVFGPVWTFLYLCIAVAGWLVWRATRDWTHPALWFWIIQLVLNGAWSWLFFSLHRPDLAFIDIGLLLAGIVAFALIAHRASAAASYLFIPYAIWVAFAAALNFAIWQMN